MSMQEPDKSKFLDCIAVGAHPDDVEIGCGGTLASLAKQGYKIGIVDLTDGEPTPHSASPGGPSGRSRSRGRSTRCAYSYSTQSFQSKTLRHVRGTRGALRKFFAFIALSSFLAWVRKPAASPDHYQTVQITDAAVFYSRLTKWDDVFDSLPVYSIPSYVYYTLAFDSVTIPPGAMGQVISDISDTLETKIKAVHCYETQFKHKAGIEEHVRTLAIRYGHMAGFTAGEMLFRYQSDRDQRSDQAGFAIIAQRQNPLSQFLKIRLELKRGIAA